MKKAQALFASLIAPAADAPTPSRRSRGQSQGRRRRRSAPDPDRVVPVNSAPKAPLTARGWAAGAPKGQVPGGERPRERPREPPAGAERSPREATPLRALNGSLPQFPGVSRRDASQPPPR
ncbi:unnamed protein product [Prorocentrum cordatum]|uniref:Uncharacterized protein n=2 Tax=Prorocentrum cordatum TaxID=2364126 RepID=A0ABN9YDW9_9DINO|nr:unnamed protein product [Polarella glacialis]